MAMALCIWEDRLLDAGGFWQKSWRHSTVRSTWQGQHVEVADGHRQAEKDRREIRDQFLYRLER